MSPPTHLPTLCSPCFLLQPFCRWNFWLWLPARRFLATDADFVSAEFGGCHSVPGRAPSDLCFESVLSWLNGVESLKIYPTCSLNRSVIPVQVLPSLFCPWQWGGVGVRGGVAGEKNTPCLQKHIFPDWQREVLICIWRSWFSSVFFEIKNSWRSWDHIEGMASQFLWHESPYQGYQANVSELWWLKRSIIREESPKIDCVGRCL